jgi:uncharacterized protein YjbI with pentapeptide repeats
LHRQLVNYLIPIKPSNRWGPLIRFEGKRMMLKNFKWAAKSFRWIFWEFLGIHYIIHKLNLTKKKSEKPPVVAGIWIIGTYIALFGLASQRYESKAGIIENRIGVIIASLSTSGFKQAIAGIANTQRSLCPVEPELWNPVATIQSLFWFKQPYSEGVGLLKETIENWKDSLNEVDLVSADLVSADLSEAGLKGANLFLVDLRGANLRGADLSSACLRNADLDSVDLEGAKLEGADLRGADLRAASLGAADLNGANLVGTNLARADLEGAHLVGADLSGACLIQAQLIEADLSEADLRGADVIIDQLLNVASLYKTTLDRALLINVKEKGPELFAKKYNDSTWVVDTILLDQIKKPNWKGWH